MSTRWAIARGIRQLDYALLRPLTEETSTIGRFGLQFVVDRPDRDRLDLGQDFRGDHRVDAQRLGERKPGAEVPAEHRAGNRTQLSAHAQRQVPDLDAFKRLRPVQDRGAVRALRFAGRAVAGAPAEVPFGEGADAFFSASSARPLAT